MLYIVAIVAEQKKNIRSLHFWHGMCYTCSGTRFEYCSLGLVKSTPGGAAQPHSFCPKRQDVFHPQGLFILSLKRFNHGTRQKTSRNTQAALSGL